MLRVHRTYVAEAAIGIPLASASAVFGTLEVHPRDTRSAAIGVLALPTLDPRQLLPSGHQLSCVHYRAISRLVGMKKFIDIKICNVTVHVHFHGEGIVGILSLILAVASVVLGVVTLL